MHILNNKTSVTFHTKNIRAKKHAFNEKIQEAVFMRGVEVIGESAFYDCRKLKKAVLPESLKTIEEDAFALCEELEEISLPENLKTIGERSFFWSGIKSIAIPESIKKIAPFTFANCRKLKEITINENCTELGDCAFSNCMELKEINIPNAVTSIGKDCFKGCSELKTIVLPDNIKILKSGTFENCISLETVVLPKNLEAIDAECFSGCSSLKSIILPDTLKTIGTKAFYRCENLESIIFPTGLSTLETRSFAGCKNLKALQLDCKLTYAGAILTDNGTVNTPDVKIMFSTSFLPKTDYRLCPTITVPEPVKQLSQGFKGILPYSYSSKNKTCFSHILAFKKYNTKIFISENYYDESYKILVDGIFDFENYDNLFQTAEAYEKPIIAAFRLAYPTELQEKYRTVYENEIKQNGKEAAVFAIKLNEEKLLQYLMDNGNFDSSFCEELYFIVSEKGLTNLLKILSKKQHNTGLEEINSLFEELIL